MPNHSAQNRPSGTIWHQLEDAWNSENWISLSLTGPTKEAEIWPRKYLIRPIVTNKSTLLQWTAFDSGKHQTHENLSWTESLKKIQSLLGKLYSSGHFKAKTHEVQIQKRQNGNLKLKTTFQTPPAQTASVGQTEPQSSSHNSSKNYLFPEGVPCPFLIATGIMNPDGTVKPSRYRKFRQINRFAEFVNDLKDHFPRDRPVRVVDYGCGKSYLTFAVRHLLVEILGLSVDMLGLDTKAEVIADCNRTADQLELTDLRFETVRIAEAHLDGPLDLAIWLHACDTATDEALARSLELRAELILAAPCCQHELHHQLNHDTWQPLLKHGIMRERLASLVTDALRGQLLEAHGYKTQIMEFIDLEQTAKNLLIRAIRKPIPPARQKQAWDAYLALKHELQVQQFELERRIGKPPEIEA